MTERKILPLWLAVPLLCGAIVLAVILTVCDVIWARVRMWRGK